MKTRASGPRRVTVELRFAPDPSPFSVVAGRALPQSWSLLSPHFRSVFLPPQWRPDGNGVTWSWREPAANPPVSAAELATLRKRLAGAQRAFAATAADAPAGDPPSATTGLAPLAACTGELVATLVALPDPALATYTAHTETGLLLHSWGLPSALTPFFPDTSDREISGNVFIAKRPAHQITVLLETEDGNPISHTNTDTEGYFHFLALPPGHYRVRADSAVTPFPPEGVAVETQRASVTRLELHDLAHPPVAANSPALSSNHRRAIIGVLLVLALGGLAFRMLSSRPDLTSETTATAITTSAPDTLAQTSNASSPPSPTRPNESSRPLSATPSPLGQPKPPASHSSPRPAPSNPSALPAGFAQNPPGSHAPMSSSGSSVLNSSPSPDATQSPDATAPPSSAAPSSSAPTSSEFSEPSSGSPLVRSLTGPSPATAPSPQQNPLPVPPSPPQSSPPPPAQPPPSPPSPTPSPTVSPEKNPDPKSEQTTSPPPPGQNSKKAPPQANPPTTDSAPSKSPNLPALASASPAPTQRRSTPTRSDLTPDTPTTPPTEPDSAELNHTPAPERALLNPPVAPTGLHARSLHLRLSPWQLRLLHDSILPTQPTRLGTAPAESIDALRTRLYREHQKKTPAVFLAPVTRRGFALELSPDSSPVRWRADATVVAVAATVVGTRAEFAWTDAGPPPAHSRFELINAADHVLAYVTFDADGEAHLTVSPPLRAWPWLELVSTAPAPLLAHTILSGPESPATWQLRSSRLDLIAPEETGRRQRTLALIDKTTGWSLVADVTQTSEP